ncbi:MAG: ferrous iron transport protein A [Firmicutes bacterium]|jgi:ferrous iron transport protein A|nr:ferrous iron transport protein A [Bacillota bacterium]
MKALNKMKIDEEGMVTKNLIENRRLQDLGVVRGTKIKCILRSPLGDPTAYKIRGAIVAIRDEDAQNVLVEVGLNE